MKVSVAVGSSQRMTATMPVVGSIQVRLPPAPEAKKLSGDALGNLPVPFNHQSRPYSGFMGQG